MGIAAKTHAPALPSVSISPPCEHKAPTEGLNYASNDMRLKPCSGGAVASGA